MDVTVVVSNYNYAQFINSAIESCLAQTVPCKIIVVDDASTDQSWEVIKGYCPEGVMGVRLKENSGGNARGKNVGICLAQTPYITCLDADDMLLPTSLECRLPFTADVDFVHGWARLIRTADSYAMVMNDYQCNPPDFQQTPKAKKLIHESKERWAFAIEASTVLSSKNAYTKWGLYDEEMRWTIDREMWWRWLSHGASKHTVDQYVSFYRRHPGQLTTDRSRKDPKQCTAMFAKRRISRQRITKDNTILMEHYDYGSLIDVVET
ncbi:MAG: glycosyltransferase family 2 protein [Promethearchaeota archaeon]|jgi:glycosyltransferase involved in cell wall biosynthesis